jgi:hypothetical protein
MNKCCIHIDDGYPESSDYDNNYVYFDPAEPDGLRKALARRNLTIEDVQIAEPFKPARSLDMKPAKPPTVAPNKSPLECSPRRKSHSFLRRLFLRDD